MPWNDEHSRFLVEDILGVRPERIALLVERIARNHPEHERERAIADTFVPRAVISGIASGLSRSLPGAIAMGLIEQRATMRLRVSMIAALEYQDDPGFFGRDDWPRRALGLDDGEASELFLRQGARFVLRLVAMRSAQRLSAMIPLPFTGWIGGAAGALFNGIEMRVIEERALGRRFAARRTETMPQSIETAGMQGG